ncbi:MAG: O-antigen ligase family protein [Candidatus Promineifilaceae bacterium]|nr:O-antigen ligase family protein [Candidatus Promineifilaceae bacterium]
MAQRITSLTEPTERRTVTQPTLFGFPTDIIIFGFIMLHIPLALTMRNMPVISPLHQVLTLGLGLWWLWTEATPRRVIYTIGYITGAEFLWRGLLTSLVWEFSKYAVILLVVSALFRFRRLGAADKRPAVYFLLLVPAISMLPGFDRGAISYNLAGPLALAVATMFFSTVSLTREEFLRLLVAIIAPVVAFGTIAAQALFQESGFSVGWVEQFGGNQVSSILGLGAMAAIFYAFAERRRRSVAVLMALIALVLLGEAVLSFSRGGVWTTVGAILAGLFFLIRERRFQLTVLALTVAVAAAAYFFILPAIDDYTGGRVVPRFQDFDTTGRDELVLSDLRIFMDYPFTGVGPGQTRPYHARLQIGATLTHTEYSRLLSEHGLLGLLALLLLAWMAAERLFKPVPHEERGYRVGFTMWGLLFMAWAATRLVAPSFAFALGAARLLVDERPENEEAEQRTRVLSHYHHRRSVHPVNGQQ